MGRVGEVAISGKQAARRQFIQIKTNEMERAVIKEGLRLSYGTVGRLPRVVPSSGAGFCGQKIQAGVRTPHFIIRYPLINASLQTLVSSSCYIHYQDPDTFVDPQAFRPERWLEDTTEGQLEEMEKKFVPFSRGSSSRIGINLAYASLHLFLAHIIHRFEISNAGTTDADMQWDDCGVPKTRGHLTVTVRESAD